MISNAIVKQSTIIKLCKFKNIFQFCQTKKLKLKTTLRAQKCLFKDQKQMKKKGSAGTILGNVMIATVICTTWGRCG